ncbi:MAG: hypothetical protein R3B84_02515 [Zavarzinella sp.]
MYRLIVCLVLVGWGITLQAQEARQLLDKSAEAMGKPADLRKLQILHYESKGIFFANDKKLNVILKHWYEFHDRSRVESTVFFDKQQSTTTVCINGGLGWLRNDKMPPRALTNDEIIDSSLDLYANWAVLMQINNERFVDLEKLADLKVQDTDCFGIRITRRSWGTTDLYFAKSDNLVRACRYESKIFGRKVSREIHFRSYKEFSGLKLSTEQDWYENSKLKTTITEIKYDFPEKLDPTLFEIPKE